MKKTSKRLITIILLITIFVLVGRLEVKAATATAELETDKTEVVPGESFTVTLSAASEQGLNAVITQISYDEEKLELENRELIGNWIDLGENNTNIELMYNSSQDMTAGEVMKITFKVKEGAKGKTEISTGEITIDTMEAGDNSSVKIEANKVEIKMGEIERKGIEMLLIGLLIIAIIVIGSYFGYKKYNKV